MDAAPYHAETYPVAPVNSEQVQLTKDEADTLKNHLESSILAEIRTDEYYDNFGYLRNLVHIYEKCREVTG